MLEKEASRILNADSVRQADVWEQIARLENSVEELAQTLKVLEERLDPVSYRVPDSKVDGSLDDPEATTGVGRRVQQATTNIEHYIKQMVYITKSLEI